MAIPCHERHERASSSPSQNDGPSTLDARSIQLKCIDEDQALGMIDGTLTSGERANIERHIDTCSACRELLSGLAQQSMFSGKPSPSSFPASAAFAGTQLAPPETRKNTKRALPAPLLKPLPASLPKPLPASLPAPLPVPKSASKAPLLVGLGVALGLLGVLVVTMGVGAAGLFYAGVRWVETAPGFAPLPTEIAPVPVPMPEPEAAPLPSVIPQQQHSQLFCRGDQGVVTGQTFTTAFQPQPVFALQAISGCRVVLEDVTLQHADAVVPTVLMAQGENVELTLRHCRVEGDVIVGGGARLRIEDSEVQGRLIGPMELVRTRQEGARDARVRVLR